MNPILLLFIQCSLSAFLKLDDRKYHQFLKEHDPAVVIIYEEWCGFSKKAIKIFSDFQKNPAFLHLNVLVGLFDVHAYPDFKAHHSVTKYPLIELHINKAKLVYSGPLSPQFLLKWLKESIGRTAIPVLNHQAFNEQKSK